MSAPESRDPGGRRVVVIGAGPAGLTAAYLLAKQGVSCLVLEKDDVVGGISRTVHHEGYHFDIGGHRFFTKVKPVEDLWHEILEDGDFLERGRLSRIYYDKKFFDYPLRASNALFGLGIFNSILIGLSYVKARILPKKEERTFEDWVSNRFGTRLYETFFKTYTEKVWGIPCKKISADWAAQRIKGLSLLTALKTALVPQRGSKVIRTLIDSFQYPKRGPGMMWERAAELVEEAGGEVRMKTDVERIVWEEGRVVAVDVVTDGKRERIEGTEFVSTMPLRDLVATAEPPPPPEILDAAHKLAYRDFLTVALMIDKEDLFPDNWIYIHDPDVKVGRIQNFKNWSPFMVPDQKKTCIGLEYFCFEGDGLWTTSDDDLVALGTKEMGILGLVDPKDVESGVVVRMPKAYPVYDDEYAEAVDKVRTYVDGLGNLYPVGRNGMHKYNNQDHSMLTAMLAVENMNGASHDIWAVNADQEYHEEVRDGDEAADQLRKDTAALARTQPLVPKTVEADPATAMLRSVFARLDPIALAVSAGVVNGLLLFAATAMLLLKGGEVIGPRLVLLGQFFPGYSVSWAGSAIGALYGFGLGAAAGGLVAVTRNALAGLVVMFVRRRVEAVTIDEPWDPSTGADPGDTGVTLDRSRGAATHRASDRDRAHVAAVSEDESR